MQPSINPELCIKCKGRLWCGLNHCPILTKKRVYYKIKKDLKVVNNPKLEFTTTTHYAFVGKTNYPRINIGVLGPVVVKEELINKDYYDNPRLWSNDNLGINEILGFRTSLINTRRKRYVKKADSYIRNIQEITLSERPISVDLKLRKKPSFRINMDPFTAPFGPNATLQRLRITENPRLKKKVEYYYSDYDAKAITAITELYKRGLDEVFLSRALSVGAFGIKAERKLVPTRWSITATDDIIAKQIIDEIRDYKEGNFEAYFGGYLGNYYLILFFPGVWSYELFETYMPKSDWNLTEEVKFTTDYEGYYGRKNYAENCIGGYYAARIGIVEKLKSKKRQASVLCIRIITPEYYMPLGVWVVREAVRKTLSKKSIVFSDEKLMLRYAAVLLKKKFNLDINLILKKSKLLKQRKEQKKIKDFFKI